jgi:hypothetical protein
MRKPSPEKVFLKPLKPSPFAAIESIVDTTTDSAAQTPRLLIVLFEDRPPESVVRMANAASETGSHLLIIGTADHPFLQHAPNLHLIEKKTARTRGVVQSAIQTAIRLKATHMMTLGAMAELTADDLALIAASIHDKPDVVIVGRPHPAAAANDRWTRWRRRW